MKKQTLFILAKKYFKGKVLFQNFKSYIFALWTLFSYLYSRIFSFVWLGLTKVSQADAGRNLWIDPSEYPSKYPKNHVRQKAFAFKSFEDVLWSLSFFLTNKDLFWFPKSTYWIFLVRPWPLQQTPGAKLLFSVCYKRSKI